MSAILEIIVITAIFVVGFIMSGVYLTWGLFTSIPFMIVSAILGYLIRNSKGDGSFSEIMGYSAAFSFAFMALVIILNNISQHIVR
jgi:hypothetical protein